MEKERKFQKNIYFYFIDFVKDFDSVDHSKLWKILKEMVYIQPYLPPEKPVCRSRSNRAGHETMDWFQIWKGVHQGCISSFCLFNLYAENIMRNAGLDKAQAWIKIAGRNINNLRWQHPYGRKWKGAGEPLDESEKG